MSITTTLTTLQGYFNGLANPGVSTWGNATALCLVRRRKVNLEDFPVILVAQSNLDEHNITFHADSAKEHVYYVHIYVFVGGENTDQEELDARIEPFPDLIYNQLGAHIELGGTGATEIILGDGVNGTFLPYRIGWFQWGANTRYFGMRAKLMVQEAASFTYGV